MPPHSAYYSVPAKALLFGEYGVLLGEPAVAVTLPQPRFDVSLELFAVKPAQAGVTIDSPWFRSGRLSLSWEIIERTRLACCPRLPATPAALASLPCLVKQAASFALSRDEVFFASILLPYVGSLYGARLEVHVKGGFAPDLGLGTSSALLSALHLFLHKQTSQADFWQRARTSLQLMQGGASGYDVAVQSAALAQKCTDVKFWRYEWQPDDMGFTPLVEPLPLPVDVAGLGRFVRTGVVAQTGADVRRFLETHDKQSFGRAQGELARAFLADPSPGNLVPLMQHARMLAQTHALLESDDGQVQALVSRLEKRGVPFKSMGSGRGDSLWVLDSAASEEDEMVVFDFARWSSSSAAARVAP